MLVLSRSYPLMSLAEQTGIPYGVVLRYADALHSKSISVENRIAALVSMNQHAKRVNIIISCIEHHINEVEARCQR